MTIAEFIERANAMDAVHRRAQTDEHMPERRSITLTRDEWNSLRDACIATGCHLTSTFEPPNMPPGAVGMVYGRWVQVA